MIMPLKATETGKISHEMSPGSIIAAGDLLASLQLAVSRNKGKCHTRHPLLHLPRLGSDAWWSLVEPLRQATKLVRYPPPPFPSSFSM